MKKSNFLLLAAFSMAIAACSPDNSQGNGGTDADAIIGSWYIGINPVWPDLLDSMRIDQPGTIVFTQDGKFAQKSAWNKADGSYSYSKGVVSATVEHSWWYDSEKEWVAVPDSELSKLPEVFSPKFLYEGNIMIQEAKLDSIDMMYPTREDLFEMLFKMGCSGPSDAALIQGFWNWKAFGRDSTSRLAVKFEGNRFELWNPSWHERFSGTFEYKDGTVKFAVDKSSFRIRRWWELPDEFEREATANLNEQWLVPVAEEGDNMEPTFGWKFVMPFVIDGTKAYSNFANLHCIFDKQ